MAEFESDTEGRLPVPIHKCTEDELKQFYTPHDTAEEYYAYVGTDISLECLDFS